MTPGTATLDPGQSATFEFTVENVGEVSLSGIKFSVTGVPVEWVGLSIGDATLSPGTMVDGSVTITIPAEHEGGTESFSVNAIAGEGAGGSDGAIIRVNAPPEEEETSEEEEGTTGALTGLFLFASENPAAVGGAVLIALIVGSIGWSVLKDRKKSKGLF